MSTEILFISGAPSTGKSTTIKEIHDYLKNNKHFVEIHNISTTKKERAFILEGYNKTGTKINIFLNYAADNMGIIKKVHNFYNKHKPFDIVITAIRDMYLERSELLKIININESYIEIPLAKVTRKKDKTQALNDYHARVFNLVTHILSLSPFYI